MAKQKWIEPTYKALAGIGALNWGLTEFFNTNLVTMVGAMHPAVAPTVYGAVGVSGALLLGKMTGINDYVKKMLKG